MTTLMLTWGRSNKMRWINTSVVSTKVINLMSIWNLAIGKFIGVSMRDSVQFLVKAKQSIWLSFVSNGSDPVPACISFINVTPKSYWGWLAISFIRIAVFIVFFTVAFTQAARTVFAIASFYDAINSIVFFQSIVMDFTVFVFILWSVATWMYTYGIHNTNDIIVSDICIGGT